MGCAAGQAVSDALDLARTTGDSLERAAERLPAGGRIERGVVDPEAASELLGAMAAEQAAGLRPVAAVLAIREDDLKPGAAREGE